MIFLASGDDDVCNYCAAASSRECDLDTAPVSQCVTVTGGNSLINSEHPHNGGDGDNNGPGPHH